MTQWRRWYLELTLCGRVAAAQLGPMLWGGGWTYLLASSPGSLIFSMYATMIGNPESNIM